MPNVCEYCGAEYDTAHTCGGVPLLSHINDMPLALKRIGELEAENAAFRKYLFDLQWMPEDYTDDGERQSQATKPYVDFNRHEAAQLIAACDARFKGAKERHKVKTTVLEAEVARHFREKYDDERNAELAALRQRLEQAENRERLALTEIKTLKDEKAALEARFALAVELAEAALKADLLLNGGLPFVGTPAEDRFYEALDAYSAAKKENNHD